MSLRQTIFSTMTSDVAVSALIGNRCYPQRLPEDVELPAVSWFLVSDVDVGYRSHGESTPRSVARIQFNCYGETSDQSNELADAVTALWSGLQNLPDIGWAQIANKLEDFDTGLNRHRSIVDVRMDYQK